MCDSILELFEFPYASGSLTSLSVFRCSQLGRVSETSNGAQQPCRSQTATRRCIIESHVALSWKLPRSIEYLLLLAVVSVVQTAMSRHNSVHIETYGEHFQISSRRPRDLIAAWHEIRRPTEIGEQPFTCRISPGMPPKRNEKMVLDSTRARASTSALCSGLP